MMLGTVLAAACAAAQADIRLEPGLWSRGSELWIITEATPAAVICRRLGDAAIQRMTPAAFRSRAIGRIQTTLTGGSPLDVAWAVAGSQAMPFGDRATLLRVVAADVLAGRTGTPDDRAAVERWLVALGSQQEPSR